MRRFPVNQRDSAVFSQLREEKLSELFEVSDGIPSANTQNQNAESLIIFIIFIIFNMVYVRIYFGGTEGKVQVIKKNNSISSIKVFHFWEEV